MNTFQKLAVVSTLASITYDQLPRYKGGEHKDEMDAVVVRAAAKPITLLAEPLARSTGMAGTASILLTGLGAIAVGRILSPD